MPENGPAVSTILKPGILGTIQTPGVAGNQMVSVLTMPIKNVLEYRCEGAMSPTKDDFDSILISDSFCNWIKLRLLIVKVHLGSE